MPTAIKQPPPATRKRLPKKTDNPVRKTLPKKAPAKPPAERIELDPAAGIHANDDGSVMVYTADGYRYVIPVAVMKASEEAQVEVERDWDATIAQYKSLTKAELAELASEVYPRNIKGLTNKPDLLEAALQGWVCDIYARHTGQYPGFVPLPNRGWA